MSWTIWRYIWIELWPPEARETAAPDYRAACEGRFTGHDQSLGEGHHEGWGLDISTFKPGSTRAAATSKAHQAGVPIDEIQRAGAWSSETTFSKWYKKELVKDKGKFVGVILGWMCRAVGDDGEAFLQIISLLLIMALKISWKLWGDQVVREDFRISRAYLSKWWMIRIFSIYLSLPPQITRLEPGPPLTKV